jgi:hypothetical protein
VPRAPRERLARTPPITAAIDAFVDNARPTLARRVRIGGGSIPSRGSNRAEAPDFAHPNPPPQWK